MTRRRVVSRRSIVVTGAAGLIGITGCLDDSGPDAEDAVETTEVNMPGWEFDPEAIQVPIDATVTWINDDPGDRDHTVTFDDEPIDLDETVAPGDELTHTFTESGTFDYYCSFHRPDMVGMVIVEE